MKKIDIKNIPWKKVGTVAMCIGAGVASAVNAFSDHKKEEELEMLKKTVSALVEKES